MTQLFDAALVVQMKIKLYSRLMQFVADDADDDDDADI